MGRSEVKGEWALEDSEGRRLCDGNGVKRFKTENSAQQSADSHNRRKGYDLKPVPYQR